MAAANTVPFPAQPASKEPTFKPWQHTVIDLITEGASVVEAMRHVGYTPFAFYKACDRDEEFKRQAHQARERFRATTAEEFHAVETYARGVVSAVLHDEQLPANLRLRAALAILNRKGDHWLPSPILHSQNVEGADPLDTLDNLDNLYNDATLEGLDNLDNRDTPDSPDRSSAVESAMHPAPPASPASPGLSPHPPSAEPGLASTAETPHPLETLDTVDALDNLDKSGPSGGEIDPDLIYCLGSRDLAASFMELLRQSETQPGVASGAISSPPATFGVPPQQSQP
ncbi:MAG: hypothetical protein IT170_14945 [Bryobacterales bacterium]|nr:hypothetical protein [Bryobacterales bacterium]